MGKASKWIRNFLIGKKEERDKKEICSAADFLGNQTAIVPATPKVKRRWSFGRSMGKETGHKFSKSFDSIDTIARAIQSAMAEHKTQQSYHVMMAANKHNEDQNAAATKIQAVFRSYLARKALCALRALVKLQALVRGYLVRKQATATLRCMQSLMAIQVRARVQRVQMTDEARDFDVKTQSSARRSFSQENELRKSFRNNVTNINEKNKTGHRNQTKIERIEHGFTTYYSGELSMLKQEHRIEKYAIATTSENSPQVYRAMSRHNPTISTSQYMQPEYKEDPMSYDNQLVPNFMAKTESSRAKVRSQSAPKQRPERSMRQKSRRSTSMEGVNVVHMQQHSPSQARTRAGRNQEPWLIKLYKSTLSFKDKESDSTSTATSKKSAYCTSLVAYDYEPHVTLY